MACSVSAAGFQGQRRLCLPEVRSDQERVVLHADFDDTGRLRPIDRSRFAGVHTAKSWLKETVSIKQTYPRSDVEHFPERLRHVDTAGVSQDRAPDD